MTLKTLKLSATTALGLIVGVTPALAQMTEVGPGEGELSIVAWAGYVERGETDPNFDWVTKFEESSGCKVSVKTANTSDEMVALMNEG
ncbi:MAG: spermidine/putrescine ABC transporter substrate-binding protein, partial [Rhodobacter sp.]|nr:spermidine/putrescine ABC transporter substrate-binding protein [Rhodobacter sp.]